MQLLHNPMARRIPRDVEMKNAPTIMANEEETVEESEGNGVDRKKVHRCNNFAVVLEKGLPPSDLVGAPGRSLYPSRNGSLRNIKSKHLQFSVNARGTPRGVLGNHLEDQFAKFTANASPSIGNRMA
jgi:hypothetical protein